jgi:hypothetical protein
MPALTATKAASNATNDITTMRVKRNIPSPLPLKSRSQQPLTFEP